MHGRILPDLHYGNTVLSLALDAIRDRLLDKHHRVTVKGPSSISREAGSCLGEYLKLPGGRGSFLEQGDS